MPHRITDFDLQAYIDGQLDADSREVVESLLEQDPSLAASVASDVALRKDITDFFNSAAEPSPQSMTLGRQLSKRLFLRRWGTGLKQAAVAASFVAAGWIGNGVVTGSFFTRPDNVPAFVDEAVEAYHSLQLKLASALKLSPDATQLAAYHDGGNVPLPPMAGPGVSFLGSDLVPWDGGTAILLAYTMPNRKVVTLFAAEADTSNETEPKLVSIEGISTVFWTRGYFAYVLSGDEDASTLMTMAQSAAAQL